MIRLSPPSYYPPPPSYPRLFFFSEICTPPPRALGGVSRGVSRGRYILARRRRKIFSVILPPTFFSQKYVPPPRALGVVSRGGYFSRGGYTPTLIYIYIYKGGAKLAQQVATLSKNTVFGQSAPLDAAVCRHTPVVSHSYTLALLPIIIRPRLIIFDLIYTSKNEQSESWRHLYDPFEARNISKKKKKKKIF